MPATSQQPSARTALNYPPGPSPADRPRTNDLRVAAASGPLTLELLLAPNGDDDEQPAPDSSQQDQPDDRPGSTHPGNWGQQGGLGQVRDRRATVPTGTIRAPAPTTRRHSTDRRSGRSSNNPGQQPSKQRWAVSYTHLTLPTNVAV